MAGGVPAPGGGKAATGVEPEGFLGFERAQEGPHNGALLAFRGAGVNSGNHTSELVQI